MITTLKQFISDSLFDAADALLSKLHITHTKEEHSPIKYADYYYSEVPQYVQNALALTKACYYIGEVCEEALQGTDRGDTSLEDDLEKLRANARYQSMMIFAIDLQPDTNVTRTDLSALTRAFNRLVYNFPVTIIFRQDKLLSIATCERTEFKQEWRQGQGEKIGKVSLLRNINCESPHRGHLMVLDEIGSQQFATFDELYANWIKVFSSELLTKKFYSELSDWYAWAVQVVRFPNDLNTRDDDDKFNHESCIRLITRLIFVWFLKQKHLIPEEFFDEQYIRDHFIREFNPHVRQTLLYNSENSKYYRLILQNLFFAMLNCPIVAEGKDTPNNRRFRGDGGNGFIREDYNVNNLMRYKSEFMDGGADEFVRIANSTVPFLNGELFECLDEKPNLYYDGFSERERSLEQLYLPDWLFFGEEVGRSIDLSQWYDDRKKRNVSARGIIDILKRYNFTIEENTPLDQEVSLDPELLGKAFENLLASYNPETKTSARKQTGSFYTPREIVQYMVDESLVAHLKRICGDENEAEYRKLLSYDTEETTLDAEQRKEVMKALYNCRVLDPACGSGAFPMGILQQKVHVLRQLDPTNEMWKDFMIDLAIKKSKEAYMLNEEEERKARLADIEEAFNRQVNDPDYARKLYLIEHCIYGVDIQPIAVQISKLRFFISLVVDQRPTADPKNNFGIRPLPNLESKFVAANTLIPVKYDGTLVENNPEVQSYKKKLKELNHQIFLAKRNVDKQKLKDEIKLTRKNLAQAIENTGFVGHSEAELLAGWDMFDQNASSPYFDAEWMFGVKNGFDIVIGNPPYIQIKKLKEKQLYKNQGFKTFDSNGDIYCLFYEQGCNLLTQNGSIIYITSNKWLRSNYGEKTRNFFIENSNPIMILDLGAGVFEGASVDTNILLSQKEKYHYKTNVAKLLVDLSSIIFKEMQLSKNTIWNLESDEKLSIKNKIDVIHSHLTDFNVELNYGILTGANKVFILSKETAEELITLDEKNKEVIKPIYRGKDIDRYHASFSDVYLLCTHNGVKSLNIPPINVEEKYPTLLPYFESFGDKFKNRGEQGNRFYNLRNCAYIMKYNHPKIIYADIVQDTGKFYYDDEGYYTNDTAFLISGDNLHYLLGILNSKAFTFIYKHFFCGSALGNKGLRYKRDFLLRVPVPTANKKEYDLIVKNVKDALLLKKEKPSQSILAVENSIDLIVYHLYNLTYDEVLIVDPETPITREKYENYNPNT